VKVTSALLSQGRILQQIAAILTLKYWCNEKLFISHFGSSDDYHFASDFVPGRCQRHHGHGDSWQRRVRLYALISDDSSRRYGALDVELERTQQYLGLARDA
jgi:hypothetical protein